jgi:pimeloyl-ACP methyl ester carboxylesterase
VLVHGFVESADTWQYTAPRLAAAGHRVYALDLDGWGYSKRVAPFTAEHQTTQLLDFIAALHLHRPVLVGHSSGAAIVAMAALRRPSAVGAVMFLDGDALNTGAGARSPLTRFLIDHYRTTILRLLLRSDAVVRSIYGLGLRRFLSTLGRPQHRPVAAPPAGRRCRSGAVGNGQSGRPRSPAGDSRPAGDDGPAQGGCLRARTTPNLTRARRTPQPHALERRLRS